MPFLWWWPLGIHPALHGTNFDLPVSQIDFFATFADIMKYPLPSGKKCVYSFNSENAAVHGQDASRIGRPGLYPNQSSPKSWLKDMPNWDWNDPSKTRFDSTLIIRTPKGGAEHVKEFVSIGADRVEQFLTKEDKTGFILGWEGCMAEDSISFKSAFSAHVVSTEQRNGKTVHKFENDLNSVPTKVQSGKLGDMSIRLGRYKLIRFNAPKDIRTGPTRQHLVSQEGVEWLEAAPADRCNYSVTDGTLLNPGCTVEPACRRYNTFGNTICMRDHYFQLFDLEKNFGEKMFCDETEGTSDVNSELSGALGAGRSRRSNYLMQKKGEKPTDPFGYGTGEESSPAGSWLNDCCVVNTDEHSPENKEFNLGCKVPDHNGPLGEGWEGNSKYSESIKLERRTNPAIEDGELDPNEFGEWTPFATCLKTALHLYEGQAYFKETEILNFHIETNKKHILDDGSKDGMEMTEDTILAGGVVGSSRYASGNAKKLFNKIKNVDDGKRFFHGAGNRYNEQADGSDSIVLKCIKFLPRDAKENATLQPMFIQVRQCKIWLLLLQD